MCMYEPDDGNGAFLEEKQRQARKQHRCEECSRTIPQGERYWYISGVYDGRFFHQHVCQHCRVGQEWLLKQCSGFILGAVEEDLSEHFQEYKMLCVGKITVGMKRQWERFDGTGLMNIPAMPGEIVIH